MTWPWQKPRIRPGEAVIRCPDCSSDQPTVSLLLLRNHVYRGGELIAVVTGERVACQACGAQYSIGPRGIFRQSPQSYPPTVHLAPHEPAPSPGDGPEVPRPLPPMPRPRPPV